MSYELWIGARYAGLVRARRRGGRGDRFVSFIAASSMAGIALGVAALIVVLSVMNGFQTQVRDRMLSVLPHIELYVPRMAPEQVLSEWRQIADRAKQNPEVQGTAPFVAAQGMIVRGEALSGVQIRGIAPDLEGEVSDVAGQMISGKLSTLTAGRYTIVHVNHFANTQGGGLRVNCLGPTPIGP